MFDRRKNEKIADLEQVNAELKGSLEKCRALLSECRGKLAANSNVAEARQEPEPDSEQKRG